MLKLNTWKYSVKGKLIALTLSVTISTLLICSIGLLIAEYTALRQQKVTNVQILARTIAPNLSAGLAFHDKTAIEEILNALRAAPTVVFARVYLPNGTAFARFNRDKDDAAGVRPVILDRSKNLIAEHVDWTLDTLEVRVPIYLEGEAIGVLAVVTVLTDIQHRLWTFTVVVLVLLAAASMITYFLTLKIQVLILRPLVELAALAQRVTVTKDYSTRVEESSQDEIGHLIKSFNEMLIEIQTRDEQLNEARTGLEQKVQLRTGELRTEMLVRREVQEALQREQEQLRTIIKQAPVAIAMLDTKLNYLAHSDRWMKDFDLAGASLITRNHLTSIANLPGHWASAYQDVLAGISVTKLEDILTLSSGTKRYLRWTAQPWYRPNGSLGGVLKVATVIDELIQARETAIGSAKLRTEFLTNISHELRTPLNAIIGFTRLLMDSSILPTERNDYLEAINHSGLLLSSLISDVLDFSKIESKKLNLEHIAFNVTDTISQSADLFRENAKLKQVALTLTFEPDLPPLTLGDPTRLKQILVNLISNALKFTNEGEITIHTRLAAANAKQCTISIEVRDTGIGIPNDKLEAVFEAFTQADGTITRQYGGTGLGLTIVRDLVSAMNGKVSVTSQIAVGSIFSISLPFELTIEASLNSGSPIGVFADSAARPLNILVAEDNKINQKLIDTVLRRRGYNVTLVENGKQAVEAVLVKSFDIVLMDLQMPEMGGVDACREIRRHEQAAGRSKSLPIIALTAHAFAEDKEACLAVGMNDYITKPIDLKKLFDCMARITSHKSPHDVSAAEANDQKLDL